MIAGNKWHRSFHATDFDFLPQENRPMTDLSTDSQQQPGMDRIRQYQQRVKNATGTEKEYQLCQKLADVVKWVGKWIDAEGGKPSGEVGGGLFEMGCVADRTMDHRYAAQLKIVRRVGNFNGRSRDASKSRGLQEELLKLADCVVIAGGTQEEFFKRRYLYDRRGRWYPYKWTELPARRPALGP